jgi:hypothetical protein
VLQGKSTFSKSMRFLMNWSVMQHHFDLFAVVKQKNSSLSFRAKQKHEFTRMRKREKRSAAIFDSKPEVSCMSLHALLHQS